MRPLSALALWLCLAPAFAHAEEGADAAVAAVADEDRSGWDAIRWIAEVDARAAQLPGMRYSARRTTVRGDVTVEERWRFVLFGGDHFRIDYFGDTARQITCDGRTLLDYIPAMGRAQRWALDELSGGEKRTMLGNVLQHVGIPGFRLGEASDVTWTKTDATHDGRPVVRLEGKGREQSELTYVIDTETLAVHHIVIRNGGKLALDARPSDHREIHPGVYFPHTVEMESPDKGGMAKVSVRLTKVAVLADSPDNLFTTTLDPSIPIEEKP